MKKRLLIVSLLAALVLLLALPVSAAWEDKVTGGGQASAGGILFSVTVSASDAPSGQMEYSRSGQSVPDLSMHGVVECLGIFSEGTVAVAAGPASVQNDPGGQVGSGAWMVVEIKEGGVGSGDTVRVRLMSESSARAACSSPSGSFPGTIYDGNFNIRAK